MVARDEEQRAALQGLADRAAANRVTVELIGASELRAQAPFLSDDVLAGLGVPDEAIVDPWALTRSYADAARAAGGRIVLGARVTGLDIDAGSVHVRTDDGTAYEADQVFDCAGLQADDIARLAGDDSFVVRPRKGEFLVLRATGGVDRIVLPVPGAMGKGMLVVPIVAGGLLLGPTARDVDDKTDRSVAASSRRRIVEACAAMVPAVRRMEQKAEFAGLRTVSSTGGSVVRPSRAGDRMWLVAGIRSTGVSISPALAEAVADKVVSVRGWQRARTVASRATVSPRR
jgi:glycerol-3-phosphate dehydrogenase